MNSGECPSCGAAQSQAWLCADCCTAVETMLAAVPQLVDQLEVAISKQAKISSGGKAGKGTAHLKEPINWDAVAVRDALLVEAAIWSGDISAIRRHPKAAEIVTAIGKAVKNAYRTIDRMQERKYLGKCNHKVGGLYCSEELWVRPNAREVRCKGCTYEHNVAARRLDMLEMASDMLVTAKDASSYLGEIGGIMLSQASIRGYVHRRRLAYRAPVEAKRFRLGDLLSVVLDESERRGAA